MIIHYNHDKPTHVYVVNSRLPVYRAWYGDGLGSTIAGLFTRLAPKVAPLAKQLGMKAIDVVRNKGFGAVGNLANRAFSAAKDKITSLVRRREKQPFVLPSMTVMSAKISIAINSAVEETLSSLAIPDAQNIAIANMIAGSGLNSKNFNSKSFNSKNFNSKSF